VDVATLTEEPIAIEPAVPGQESETRITASKKDKKQKKRQSVTFAEPLEEHREHPGYEDPAISSLDDESAITTPTSEEAGCAPEPIPGAVDAQPRGPAAMLDEADDEIAFGTKKARKDRKKNRKSLSLGSDEPIAEATVPQTGESSLLGVLPAPHEATTESLTSGAVTTEREPISAHDDAAPIEEIAAAISPAETNNDEKIKSRGVVDIVSVVEPLAEQTARQTGLGTEPNVGPNPEGQPPAGAPAEAGALPDRPTKSLDRAPIGISDDLQFAPVAADDFESESQEMSPSSQGDGTSPYSIRKSKKTGDKKKKKVPKTDSTSDPWPEKSPELRSLPQNDFESREIERMLIQLSTVEEETEPAESELSQVSSDMSKQSDLAQYLQQTSSAVTDPAAKPSSEGAKSTSTTVTSSDAIDPESTAYPLRKGKKDKKKRRKASLIDDTWPASSEASADDFAETPTNARGRSPEPRLREAFTEQDPCPPETRVQSPGVTEAAPAVTETQASEEAKRGTEEFGNVTAPVESASPQSSQEREPLIQTEPMLESEITSQKPEVIHPEPEFLPQEQDKENVFVKFKSKKHGSLQESPSEPSGSRSDESPLESPSIEQPSVEADESVFSASTKKSKKDKKKGKKAVKEEAVEPVESELAPSMPEEPAEVAAVTDTEPAQESVETSDEAREIGPLSDTLVAPSEESREAAPSLEVPPQSQMAADVAPSLATPAVASEPDASLQELGADEFDAPFSRKKPKKGKKKKGATQTDSGPVSRVATPLEEPGPAPEPAITETQDSPAAEAVEPEPEADDVWGAPAKKSKKDKKRKGKNVLDSEQVSSTPIEEFSVEDAAAVVEDLAGNQEAAADSVPPVEHAPTQVDPAVGPFEESASVVAVSTSEDTTASVEWQVEKSAPIEEVQPEVQPEEQPEETWNLPTKTKKGKKGKKGKGNIVSESEPASRTATSILEAPSTTMEEQTQAELTPEIANEAAQSSEQATFVPDDLQSEPKAQAEDIPGASLKKKGKKEKKRKGSRIVEFEPLPEAETAAVTTYVEAEAAPVVIDPALEPTATAEEQVAVEPAAEMSVSMAEESVGAQESVPTVEEPPAASEPENEPASVEPTPVEQAVEEPVQVLGAIKPSSAGPEVAAPKEPVLEPLPPSESVEAQAKPQAEAQPEESWDLPVKGKKGKKKKDSKSVGFTTQELIVEKLTVADTDVVAAKEPTERKHEHLTTKLGSGMVVTEESVVEVTEVQPSPLETPPDAGEEAWGFSSKKKKGKKDKKGKSKVQDPEIDSSGPVTPAPEQAPTGEPAVPVLESEPVPEAVGIPLETPKPGTTAESEAQTQQAEDAWAPTKKSKKEKKRKSKIATSELVSGTATPTQESATTQETPVLAQTDQLAITEAPKPQAEVSPEPQHVVEAVEESAAPVGPTAEEPVAGTTETPTPGESRETLEVAEVAIPVTAEFPDADISVPEELPVGTADEETPVVIPPEPGTDPPAPDESWDTPVKSKKGKKDKKRKGSKLNEIEPDVSSGVAIRAEPEPITLAEEPVAEPEMPPQQEDDWAPTKKDKSKKKGKKQALSDTVAAEPAESVKPTEPVADLVEPAVEPVMTEVPPLGQVTSKAVAAEELADYDLWSPTTKKSKEGKKQIADSDSATALETLLFSDQTPDPIPETETMPESAENPIPAAEDELRALATEQPKKVKKGMKQVAGLDADTAPEAPRETLSIPHQNTDPTPEAEVIPEPTEDPAPVPSTPKKSKKGKAKKQLSNPGSGTATPAADEARINVKFAPEVPAGIPDADVSLDTLEDSLEPTKEVVTKAHEPELEPVPQSGPEEVDSWALPTTKTKKSKKGKKQASEPASGIATPTVPAQPEIPIDAEKEFIAKVEMAEPQLSFEVRSETVEESAPKQAVCGAEAADTWAFPTKKSKKEKKKSKKQSSEQTSDISTPLVVDSLPEIPTDTTHVGICESEPSLRELDQLPGSTLEQVEPGLTNEEPKQLEAEAEDEKQAESASIPDVLVASQESHGVPHMSRNISADTTAEFPLDEPAEEWAPTKSAKKGKKSMEQVSEAVIDVPTPKGLPVVPQAEAATTPEMPVEEEWAPTKKDKKGKKGKKSRKQASEPTSGAATTLAVEKSPAHEVEMPIVPEVETPTEASIVPEPVPASEATMSQDVQTDLARSILVDDASVEAPALPIEEGKKGKKGKKGKEQVSETASGIASPIISAELLITSTPDVSVMPDLVPETSAAPEFAEVEPALSIPVDDAPLVTPANKERASGAQSKKGKKGKKQAKAITPELEPHAEPSSRGAPDIIEDEWSSSTKFEKNKKRKADVESIVDSSREVRVGLEPITEKDMKKKRKSAGFVDEPVESSELFSTDNVESTEPQQVTVDDYFQIQPAIVLPTLGLGLITDEILSPPDATPPKLLTSLQTPISVDDDDCAEPLVPMEMPTVHAPIEHEPPFDYEAHRKRAKTKEMDKIEIPKPVISARDIAASFLESDTHGYAEKAHVSETETTEPSRHEAREMAASYLDSTVHEAQPEATEPSQSEAREAAASFLEGKAPTEDSTPVSTRSKGKGKKKAEKAVAHETAAAFSDKEFQDDENNNDAVVVAAQNFGGASQKKGKRHKVVDKRTIKEDDMFDDEALWEGAENRALEGWRLDEMTDNFLDVQGTGAEIKVERREEFKFGRELEVKQEEKEVEPRADNRQSEFETRVSEVAEQKMDLDDNNDMIVETKRKLEPEILPAETDEIVRSLEPVQESTETMLEPSKTALGRQDSETIPRAVREGRVMEKKRQDRDSPQPVQRAFSFPDDIADEEAFTAKPRSVEEPEPSMITLPRVSSISDLIQSVTSLPPVQEEVSSEDEPVKRHSRFNREPRATTPTPNRDSGVGPESPHLSRRLQAQEGLRDSGVHFESAPRQSHDDKHSSGHSYKSDVEEKASSRATRAERKLGPGTPRLREPSPTPRTPEPEKLGVLRKLMPVESAGAALTLPTLLDSGSARSTPRGSSNAKTAAVGAIGAVVGTAVSARSVSDNQPPRSLVRTPEPAPRRSASNTSLARLRTPEPLRPDSPGSIRSSYTGTPPLRRVDKRVSGDLRSVSLSQRDKNLAGAAVAGAALGALGAAIAVKSLSEKDNTPVANEGRVRARDMTDVYVRVFFLLL